jgi:hypothetical protein
MRAIFKFDKIFIVVVFFHKSLDSARPKSRVRQ